MTPAALHRWDAVHRWSSLGCTVFLLLLCLTGLPLVFHDEIDAALAPAVERPRPGAPMTIDALVARVRERNPGTYVQFVFWDAERPGALGFGLADTADADLEHVRRSMVGLVDGEPVPLRVPPGGVMTLLLDLHKSLFLDLPGQLLLAVVALAFLVSVVSGVAVYAPFLRRRAFGAVRAHGARRSRWLDRHNLIGIALTAWLGVVGATGLMNALEGPLFGAWNATTMPRLLEPYRGQPYPERLSSVDAAVRTARAALPDMRPTSVGFPYSRFGSPRHYLIWMKGETPLTEHFFTPVLVDAASGALAAAEGLPWYLRALEISRPLHFGDYGGWPLKLIWAGLDLLAIVVLASGVYLWLARGKRRRPTAATALAASQPGSDRP